MAAFQGFGQQQQGFDAPQQPQQFQQQQGQQNFQQPQQGFGQQRFQPGGYDAPNQPPQQFQQPPLQFEMGGSEAAWGGQAPSYTSDGFSQPTPTGGSFYASQAGTSFGYDPSGNELPLLEELGVDFGDIWSKTKLVLTPSFRTVDERLVEGSDLVGPIFFVLLLAGALVLRGKLHFGYIYGFGLSSCVATYVLLNLMHQDGGVAFSTVVSFLGYCLLPVVLLAFGAIGVSVASVPGQALGGLAVLASTCTSTRLFEAKLHMRPQRYLIAYPLALIYSCFVLITIF